MGNIFREQLLTFCEADATSLTVVGELSLVNASYGEVVSVRMADEESADGG